MKIHLVLILAVLFSHTFSYQDLDKKRPSIDDAQRPFSGTFAASWLGGFCQQSNRCDQKHIDQWDRQSFTIHGLWPSARTLTPQSYANFSLKYIKADPDLHSEMMNYWPAQSNYNKSEDWLWIHEYNKHGKDYSDILGYYQPDEYIDASEETLQQTYFTAGLNFYKKLNLEKINLTAASKPVKVSPNGDVVLTKAQLGEIIGLDVDTFLLNCRKDKDFLEEIQICFRIQKNLDTWIENCRAVKANQETPYPMTDNCPKYFRLIGYKKPDAPSQKQVTKYTDQNSKNKNKKNNRHSLNEVI